MNQLATPDQWIPAFAGMTAYGVADGELRHLSD